MTSSRPTASAPESPAAADVSADSQNERALREGVSRETVVVRWPRYQAERVEKALALAVEGQPNCHAEQRALSTLRKAVGGREMREILFSAHAFDRYRERVDPTATDEDLQRIVDAASFSTRWGPNRGPRPDGYLVVSDSCAFVLRRSGSVVRATTCLTRGAAQPNLTGDGIASEPRSGASAANGSDPTPDAPSLAEGISQEGKAMT